MDEKLHDSATTSVSSDSYQRHVSAMCQKDPGLSNLVDFLAANPPYPNLGRIVSLEFSSASKMTCVRDLDAGNLEDYVQLSEGRHDLLGRLLIVEDLSRDVIEILGSNFQLDPKFFAHHLYSSRREKTATKGPAYTLPSVKKKRDFLNINYSHSVLFSGSDQPTTWELRCLSNVRRKAVITTTANPVANNGFVGHVARQFSVLAAARRSGTCWLGLVLVDPPIGGVFPSDVKSGKSVPPYICQTEPVQGGYVDFSPAGSEGCPKRLSMLDDLIHYWTNDRPPGFDPTSPSLLSLSYYPIKIVAAELHKMTNTLNLIVGGYDVSLEGGWRGNLEKLEFDLRFLYGWQRRCASFARRIHVTREFIERNKPEDSEIWADVALDYHFLADRIDYSRKQFEVMIPVVTSKIQIVESRSSFEEATNLSRLTHLALVFVPLTFVASLFSMAGDVSPGNEHFWVYFAVAIPFLAATFGVLAAVGGTRMLKSAQKIAIRNYLTTALSEYRVTTASGAKAAPSLNAESA